MVIYNDGLVPTQEKNTKYIGSLTINNFDLYYMYVIISFEYLTLIFKVI